MMYIKWRIDTSYLWHIVAIGHDSSKLTGIALAAVMALWSKDRLSRALIYGVGLYLLYIVWIGGDFMNGRFYYQKLKLVVRGEFFAPDRLKEIWNINTGKYSYLLDDYSYLRTDRLESTLEIVNPNVDPVVVVFVQNESRINTFVIDNKSHKGKKYSVRLIVGKNQVKLEGHCLKEKRDSNYPG